MGLDYAMAVAQESMLQKLPARCKNVMRYSGLRKPQCSGRKGCQACWNIYYIKHPTEDYRGTSADPMPCH